MLPNEDHNFGNPKAIIILSGKRKSGKDFVANILFKKFQCDEAVIIRLSGPLKERYAFEHNLDYKKLLDCSAYKEIYREKMIKWGEEIRSKDTGYFCRHAIAQVNASYMKVWIVSDARRKTDLQFFLTYFPSVTHTVRIHASDETREHRGWQFTEGVDDAESECGLDEYDAWNFHIQNNNPSELEDGLNNLLEVMNIVLEKE